ncbi:hypothetical protein ACM26T_23060, partial [Kluyvera sichuanensis]|uniref:hypothetical protein n=1 Tax=Kluyvera sichuanensis TaxID=2725494 RepID=UPI0039F6EA55
MVGSELIVFLIISENAPTVMNKNENLHFYAFNYPLQAEGGRDLSCCCSPAKRSAAGMSTELLPAALR